MFWEKFQELCKKTNKRGSFVAKELGLSNSVTSKWKNGSLPNSEILLQLADYFNCSVDYLLDRETPTNSITSRDHNTNIIGSNNTINLQITPDEEELLKLYRSLDSIIKKAKVVSFIAETLDN